MKVKELINLLKECESDSDIEVSIEDKEGKIFHHEINFISYGDLTIPCFINIQDDTQVKSSAQDLIDEIKAKLSEKELNIIGKAISKWAEDN